MVWTGAENLAPTRIRYPACPARSEALYRLSYPGPHHVWEVLDSNLNQEITIQTASLPADAKMVPQTWSRLLRNIACLSRCCRRLDIKTAEHCTFSRRCYNSSQDSPSFHRTHKRCCICSHPTATKVRLSAASCHEPNRQPIFNVQSIEQHIHTNSMQQSPSGEANSS